MLGFLLGSKQTRGLFHLSFVEGKEAYPYIAEFKKEPFKSFVFVKSKDIGSFYFGEYDRVLKIYLHFNENILVDKEVNIETVYWFLLLRKYLKQDIDEYKNEIFKFIKSCELEVVDEDQIGFKLSPHSPDISDIWSTYHALSCLKILGLLDQYLLLEGQNSIVRKIKNFTLAHKKHNGFLHCLSKDCRFKRTPSSYLTLYYVMEIFVLLGIDLRLYKNHLLSFLTYYPQPLLQNHRQACFLIPVFVRHPN